MFSVPMMTNSTHYGTSFERNTKALSGKVTPARVSCQRVGSLAADGSRCMKHEELRVMQPRSGKPSPPDLARDSVELQCGPGWTLEMSL